MWVFQWDGGDDLCRVRVQEKDKVRDAAPVSSVDGGKLWICSHANKGSRHGQAANEGQEGKVEKC